MPVPPDSPRLPPDGQEGVPTTLATATLPRRVRRVLEHLLAMVSEEMARHLGQMLGDFEQQLFRLADHARNPALQSGHLETLRTLRLNRSDLVPRYLMGLEAGLAGLRHSAVHAATGHRQKLPFAHLSLVEDHDLDEEAVLREIAMRHEARASLALHLLGQRFGVLAGAPAMDAERLPLGPHALGRVLRESSHSLQIGLEPRLLLFRTFERQVMNNHYPQLAEMMNALLASENVLPSLAYVPIRARPTLQNPEAAADGGDARPGHQPSPAGTTAGGGGRRGGLLAREDRGAQRPHTAWPGEVDPQSAAIDEDAAFALLQQLLSGRRGLIGKLRPDKRARSREALDTDEVVRELGNLQPGGERHARGLNDIGELRQALLARARQKRGHAATLAGEDNDAFELLDMLFDQIGREVRQDTPARSLLGRLQVPLLQVALRDRAFFVRSQHPARQLLNAVAESGAIWLAEDDVDPQLANQLKLAVDHVAEHYQDDPAAFEHANQALQEQLQLLARKAAVTERRHVEAARGKEKLAVAKRRAADVIDAALRDQRLPKFVRALLNQAWADVLTLTLLRHGDESPEWKRQLEATTRIVAATGRGGASDPVLSDHIEGALVQVGYHVDEASAIARRLTAGVDEDEDDPASRTELAMKLKARGRLGEDAVAPRQKLPPRSAQEQAAYDYVRTLPFGTWFEFVTNQQGDRVRHRLSWFSPVTDNALFVNQRGHRVGEHSLDSLARMLARGQVRVVTADRGRLVDRAWHGALNALRSFASSGQPGERTAQVEIGAGGSGEAAR
jgi:hypothetical protein